MWNAFCLLPICIWLFSCSWITMPCVIWLLSIYMATLCSYVIMLHPICIPLTYAGLSSIIFDYCPCMTCFAHCSCMSCLFSIMHDFLMIPLFICDQLAYIYLFSLWSLYLIYMTCPCITCPAHCLRAAPFCPYMRAYDLNISYKWLVHEPTIHEYLFWSSCSCSHFIYMNCSYCYCPWTSLFTSP